MKLSIQRKIILGFALTFSLIIIVSLSGYYSAFRLRETNQQALQGGKVLTTLEEVLAEITDAETGERGYLLTGKPRYLEPYKQAVDKLEDDIKQLQVLTADHPYDQRKLEIIIPLIHEKFSELQQTINLRNEQGLEAALEIVNTNKDTVLMDQIRTVFRQMKAEEEQLLQARSQHTQVTVRSTILILSGGLILDLGILVFVYSNIYREINQRLKAQEQLRASENRLTQFLEAIPVGVFVVDHQGIPYYANQTAKKLFGQGLIPTDLAHQLPEIYPIYSPNAEKVHPCNLEPIIQALNGKSSSHDGIEIHQPDKIVPIEVLGTPIFDDQGNISYAIVVLNDITLAAPDVLFMPLWSPETGLLANRIIDKDGLAETIVIITDTAGDEFTAQAERGAQGVYMLTTYLTGEDYEAFLERYSEINGFEPPSEFHAQAYDAAVLLLDTIEATAEALDENTVIIGRQALRDALTLTENYAGLTGRLTCTDTGDCASTSALGAFLLSEDRSGAWSQQIIYTPSR